MRTGSAGPQGQDESGRDPKEDREWLEILEKSSFMSFQSALARRRAEDIMRTGDLAMATWYRELAFIHIVLSEVNGLLRKVGRYGAAKGWEAPDSVGPQATGLGPPGEQ